MMRPLVPRAAGGLVKLGAIAAATTWISGCGSGGQGSAVATNPPVPVTSGPPGQASAGVDGSVRTILSPLGVNIRADASATATAVGTAAQGAVLTVLEYTGRNGGWYRVHGETAEGWLSADSSLSAPGRFNLYQSDQRYFNALYPQDWTFAEAGDQVAFKPPRGVESIVVRQAATGEALGPAGRPGYVAAVSQPAEVCGLTGILVVYTRGGAPSSPSSQPMPSEAAGPTGLGVLARLAQLRLRLDSTHALELDHNYDSASAVDNFRQFYASVTFPFPQCRQTTTPSPPAPSAPSPA